jgi:RNA polymerase sigma factor (sigma-70 family)
MQEDKTLIEELQRGDREAFSRIYYKYVDFLVTVAISLLSDPHAAEDVVQDVFVAFARNSQVFRLTGSLKGYLAACTANRARDWYRQRRGDMAFFEDYRPFSNEKDPREQASQQDQLDQIRQAMAELPYDQRESIVLRLLGDLKFREIARKLNIPLKTVQSRYRYGLDKLRTLLDGRAHNVVD